MARTLAYSYKKRSKAPAKLAFRRKFTRPSQFRRGQSIPMYPSEMKTKDIDVAVYAGDTTGSITLLNGIAAGDDYTERDGRQVTVKSVQIQGRVFSADNEVLNCFTRVMLIWDSQPNGAAPTMANFFLTTTNACNFMNPNWMNRFTVLADVKNVTGLVLTSASPIAYSPNVHVVDCYRKVNRVTQYMGTDALIGSIATGALWMVTIGDQAAGSGSTYNMSVRVRFTDK